MLIEHGKIFEFDYWKIDQKIAINNTCKTNKNK